MSPSTRNLLLFESFSTRCARLPILSFIGTVVRLADLGNGIMSKKEPWMLAKKAKDDAKAERQSKKIFSELLAITYAMGILLYPFAPKASAELLSYFGIDTEPTLEMLNNKVKPNLDEEPKPIFQKMTNKEIEKLKKYA